MVLRRTLFLVMVCFGVAAMWAPNVARAQDTWSMAVVACSPTMTAGAHENLTHVLQTAQGGYRAIFGGTSTGGRTYVCPVTLGQGAQPNAISVRAWDNVAVANNYVAAAFWTQPISGPNNAWLLGSVVSEDSAELPHTTVGYLGSVTIDNNLQTYFVTVTLSRTSSNYDIRAYQVRVYYSAGAALTPGESLVPASEADCAWVVEQPEWAITDRERFLCFVIPQ